MRLNILLMIPSFHQGGSERQGLKLARLLSETGRYNVTLACLDRSGVLLPEAKSLGLDEIPQFPLNSFYDPNMVRQLRRCARLLKTRSIDIVQTFDFYTNVFGLTAAALARVPLRIGARRETAGHRTSAQRWIERRAFQVAHVIVANSDAVRKELIRDGVRPSKVVTVYNGVDTDRVGSPAEAAGLFGWPLEPARRIVTIVANLRSPYKDHPTFIRAARLVSEAVPEASFAIAGEGPLIEPMQSLAHELGIGEQTIFLGRFMQVPELLSASDVCVLSSKDGEGFSNAIIEYMSAARPVVATDVGGAREAIVNGETGWIVAPGDHAALAARIIDLLRDPQRAREMGERGRQIVTEKFSPAVHLQQIEALYRDLLPKTARTELHEISPLETIK